MAMAMEGAKGSLDYWRNVFSSLKYDVFELIDNAILIAATDYPKEFKEIKIMIAEKLCTSQLSLSYECKRTGLEVLNNGGDEHPKEEKISSSCEDTEERQIVREVMRIKEVLCNHPDESDSVLYESLSRLQLIQFSVETLKETEIGKVVNALRKHNSGQIRKLVRVLIKGWRVLVDEWIKSTANAIQSIATYSVDKPSKSSATDSGALGYSPNRTPEQKPSSHFSTGAKRKQPEEVLHASKLEITKRKLREGYQRAEHAKKQRMIQIIELRNLPMASPEKRRLKN